MEDVTETSGGEPGLAHTIPYLTIFFNLLGELYLRILSVKVPVDIVIGNHALCTQPTDYML